MKFLAFFLISLSLASAFKYDSERDLNKESEFVDKREATRFLRSFLHPFKTKNEEIKRETREVYEEKCENVIPWGRRYNTFLELI